MSNNNTSEETPSSKDEKKGQVKKTLIRLLISIIAFIALIKFGKVNVKEALSHLSKMNLLYFGISYIFYTGTIFFSGVRFHIASQALGFKKSINQCIQLNYVGSFFNNFLPTTFGGDALRGYYLQRGSNISLSKTAGCVLCERYFGMVVLFWFCSLTFLFKRFGFIQNNLWNVPIQMEYFAHLGTFGSIFVIPFIPQIKVMIFGKENWMYKKFIEPIIVYWNSYGLSLKIIFYSMLLQLFVIVCHYYLALAFNLNIPLSYYFIFYPLTTIAGFLVPSLNGLGVREGTYIYFLSLIGIEKDIGLAFSMGFLIVLLITSVIGGLVYMMGDFRKNH